MSRTVPQLLWRGALLALATAACLLAAAPVLAAQRERPTAAPLWQAYPLAGKQASEPTAAQPQVAAPTPSQPSDSLLHTNVPTTPVTPLREQQQKVAPAIVVVFYIAILTLIVTLGVLVRRQLRRGRSPRTVRG
jgi:hypothetical protein